MTTGDWAFVISIFSTVLSLAGFVWSVWSHFLYPKPKVRATIGIFQTYSAGRPPSPSFLSMSATNYGPGEVTITHAGGTGRSLRPKREALDFMFKIATSPEPWNSTLPQYDVFGFGLLPKKLAVGEQFNVQMSMDQSLFDDHYRAKGVGFRDTFGRWHFVSKKQLKRLRADLKDRAVGTAGKPA